MPPQIIMGARSKARFARPREKDLAFRELEPLASALLAVLFPLALPGVPCEVTELLEPGPQLRIKLHQRPGDPEAHRARLAVNTAAMGENQNVELIGRLGGEQRLLHRSPRRLRGEIILERTTVDRDIALPRPQKDPGHRRLAASRSQILYDLRCHS